MTTPTDGFVTARGARLHYADWGGDGPPLLLLHGLQDCTGNWEHIAPELTNTHHVYALDSRGHGDSEHVPGHYQFDNYVGEVGEAIEALGLDDVVLVGHSAGGKYGFAHIAQGAPRVSRLVIVDMDPDQVNPGSATMFDRYRDEGDEWPDLAAVVERLRAREPRSSEAVLEGQARAMTRPLPDGRLVWKRDRQVVLQYERPEAWDLLPNISVPTLLVRGADSPLLRREVAERMADAIPDCTLVEVADGGHWCYGENPAGFLAALAPFIRRS